MRRSETRDKCSDASAKRCRHLVKGGQTLCEVRPLRPCFRWWQPTVQVRSKWLLVPLQQRSLDLEGSIPLTSEVGGYHFCEGMCYPFRFCGPVDPIDSSIPWSHAQDTSLAHLHRGYSEGTLPGRFAFPPVTRILTWSLVSRQYRPELVVLIAGALCLGSVHRRRLIVEKRYPSHRCSTTS